MSISLLVLEPDITTSSTEIALHQPSSQLFLACSEPEYRTLWLPSDLRLNVTGASQDYVAIYDMKTFEIRKLEFSGVDGDFGFSSHGMDIVPSALDPSELFVYLINHRPPKGVDARLSGADSVVEIFKHRLGNNKLTHVSTVESPLMIAPNDLTGSDDGNDFYFTNDHGHKLGIVGCLVEYLYFSCHDLNSGGKLVYSSNTKLLPSSIVTSKKGASMLFRTCSPTMELFDLPMAHFMSLIRCLVDFQSLKSSQIIPWSLPITFKLVC